MNTIYSRRDFVKTSLVAGGVWAFGNCLVAEADEASSGKRPNILWIQTDEQRPDSLGCYGSEWAHTPNLDRLAERGVVFHECHVQSPVCIPSRTSMLACKYPQEINVMGNSTLDGKKLSNRPGLFAEQDKFFPNLFADAGYRTASIGKWHTPRHKTWQENELFIHFDEVAGFYGLAEGYSEEEHRVVKRPGGSKIIIGGIYPEHDGGITPSSHVTDMAIEWLKTRGAKGDEPFLLRVSHCWPHTPVLVPRPWDTLYKPDDVPCRANNRTSYEGRAEYDRTLADGHGGFKLSKETWQQNAADYYGLCSYVDHEVGRLLQALEELGLTENTIIAYNADHGRNLGENGTCEKNTYDREVWRIPFILAWPGHIPEGEDRYDLMELMDFGPTLCSLAGVPLEEGMRGRDLFHSEEPDAVFGVVQTWGLWTRAAVRTKRYRYECTLAYHNQFSNRQSRIEAGDYDPNLFDLEKDPFEENNLIHNPEMAGIAAELHTKLENWYRKYSSSQSEN